MIKNQFHYALNLSYDTKLTDTVSNIRNIQRTPTAHVYTSIQQVRQSHQTRCIHDA